MATSPKNGSPKDLERITVMPRTSVSSITRSRSSSSINVSFQNNILNPRRQNDDLQLDSNASTNDLFRPNAKGIDMEESELNVPAHVQGLTSPIDNFSMTQMASGYSHEIHALATSNNSLFSYVTLPHPYNQVSTFVVSLFTSSYAFITLLQIVRKRQWCHQRLN